MNSFIIKCDDGNSVRVPEHIVNSSWYFYTLFKGPFREAKELKPVHIPHLSSKALKITIAFLEQRDERALPTQSLKKLDEAFRLYSCTDFLNINSLVQVICLKAKSVFLRIKGQFVEKKVKEVSDPNVDPRQLGFFAPMLLCRAIREGNKERVSSIVSRAIVRKEVSQLVHSPMLTSYELWNITRAFLESRSFKWHERIDLINQLLKLQQERLDRSQFSLFQSDVFLRLAPFAQNLQQLTSICIMGTFFQYTADTSAEALFQAKEAHHSVCRQFKEDLGNALRYDSICLSPLLVQLISTMDLFIAARAKQGETKPFLDLFSALPGWIATMVHFFDLTLPRPLVNEDLLSRIQRAQSEKLQDSIPREQKFNEQREEVIQALMSRFLHQFYSRLCESGHFDSLFHLLSELIHRNDLREHQVLTRLEMSPASIKPIQMKCWIAYEEYLSKKFSKRENQETFANGFLKNLQFLGTSPYFEFAWFQRTDLYRYISKALEVYAQEDPSVMDLIPRFALPVTYRDVSSIIVTHSQERPFEVCLSKSSVRGNLDALASLIQQNEFQEASWAFMKALDKPTLLYHLFKGSKYENLISFILFLEGNDQVESFQILIHLLILHNGLQEAIEIFLQYYRKVALSFPEETRRAIFQVRLASTCVKALLDHKKDLSQYDKLLSILSWSKTESQWDPGMEEEMKEIARKMVRSGFHSDGLELAKKILTPISYLVFAMEVAPVQNVKLLERLSRNAKIRMKWNIVKSEEFVRIDFLPIINTFPLTLLVVASLFKSGEKLRAFGYLGNNLRLRMRFFSDIQISEAISRHLPVIFDCKWMLFQAKLSSEARSLPWMDLSQPLPWESSEEAIIEDALMPDRSDWIPVLSSSIIKYARSGQEVLDFLDVMIEPCYHQEIFRRTIQLAIEKRTFGLAEDLIGLLEQSRFPEILVLKNLISSRL